MREIRFVKEKKKRVEETIKKVERKLQDNELNYDNIDQIDIKKLSKKEVDSILHAALHFDILNKELAGKVKKLKTMLLEYAKEKELYELKGEGVKAKVSNKTITEISPIEYAKLLKKLDKSNIFADTVKVQLTEAKKYVAQNDLDTISNKSCLQYASISIKQN